MTAAISAIGLCLTFSSTGFAQSVKPSVSPVQIKGFDYRFIAKRRLHMHVCKVEACGIGSKVSYLFLPADKAPSFEHFKNSRRRIAHILRQRAPNGAQLYFEKPTVRKNSVITVFSQFRKVTLVSGKTLFTKSTVVHSKTTSISLISSSPKRAAAHANRSKFGVALAKMIRKLQGDRVD